MRTPWSVVLVFLVCLTLGQGNDVFNRKRKTHKCKALKEDALRRVATFDYAAFKRSFLRFILRPRVPDTDGSRAVQQFLKNTLDLPGWQVEEDQFQESTPRGVKTFTNIIAKFNPGAERFLNLACHYDSKDIRGFVGATDSAVPCAMLLEIATSLKQQLNDKKNGRGGFVEDPGDEMCFCQCGTLDLYNGLGELGLQLVFFDGEEAFVTWSRTDSLYGARHLAAKLESESQRVEREITVNNLQRMDLMVLLDLIGAGNSKFYNWFPRLTGTAFERMLNIQTRLMRLGLIRKEYFVNGRAPSSGIEDDHIPFLQRDVPILHMIAYPFPSVWHRVSDNEAALNADEIKEVVILMKVFVCEYMRLAC